MPTPNNLYLVHVSIHGLIRGRDLELGRDADTGGQTLYVVELVKALARQKEVDRVDLLTRRVVDQKVSDDYARPEEDLGDGAFIRRIEAGPRRYLRKESLWKYLDLFIDHALEQFRSVGRVPDLIHAHYADAGYVGRQLATLLGCPFVFTGHSQGRVKKEKLQSSGLDEETIQKRYNIARRIEAEEQALDAASLTITSTHQEIEEQYAQYENYLPEKMKVVPPGVNLRRFQPPGEAPSAEGSRIAAAIDRFLDEPNKPLVLALARADERKNLVGLLREWGRDAELREKTNLVILAGNRETIDDLDRGARRVINELLRTVDDLDLYGKVALPKKHRPEDVPVVYRLAAERRGCFVNSAWTENFGLTAIEAAASGLPLVLTNDGGPRDIIANCQSGELVDPREEGSIAAGIAKVVLGGRWDELAESGLTGVRKHYSWDAHAESYLAVCNELLGGMVAAPGLFASRQRSRLPLVDRVIFAGMGDDLHESEPEAIGRLRQLIEGSQFRIGWGIVSARRRDEVERMLARYELPPPDVLITRLGANIHYGKDRRLDHQWEKHMEFGWERDAVVEVLSDVDGLDLQPDEHQHRFKVSWFRDPDRAPDRAVLQRLLREAGLQAKVIVSEGTLVDALPLRSDKGQAIRYLAWKWKIPHHRMLMLGRMGNDLEALQSSILGVVPSPHSAEMEELRDHPRVHFSERPGFAALMEGVEYYGFDKPQLEDEEVEYVEEPEV